MEDIKKQQFISTAQSQEPSALSFVTDSYLELEHLENSSEARHLKRALAIADFLVDDKGQIIASNLDKLIKEFSQHLYTIGGGREADFLGREHQLQVLKKLKEPSIVKLLFLIDAPERNKTAERLIQETLSLDFGKVISKRETILAALSAWLTPLRQNVGSCFATAPALLVQEEKPELLLKDFREMLATGRLTRTIAGNSFQVPLSSSFGIGNLNRQVTLLRDEDSTFQELAAAIDMQKALEVDEKELYSLLKKALPTDPVLSLSYEEIIKKIIQFNLSLTDKDLHDYELRPKQMVYASLLMVSEASSKKNLSLLQRCTLFHELVKKAEGAFVRLTDHPLLRAWEYTIASFAETKSSFATWNLYSSLGLDPSEPGGIGQVMKEVIEGLLYRRNKRVEDLHEEYKMIYHQLTLAEGRLKSASSEDQARWIRADYQIKRNEYQSIEEMRDRENNNAKRLAHLYNTLTDHFLNLFPSYFQEVYDPDLHQVSQGPYDDTPAGFRLMYKHGRESSASWTFVYNYPDFINALNQFFVSAEHQLEEDDNIRGIEKDISEVITAICLQIKSPDFIESAFYRMAKAHKTPFIEKPLDNLEKIEKKPWCYTSGGGMSNLYSHYFSEENPPKDTHTWVESPMELFVFLVDTIKQLPAKEIDRFLHNPQNSLLIHSPTHAFRLLPGLYPFSQAFKNQDFTYTYLRDNFVNPRIHYYQNLLLDQETIHYLLSYLKTKLPTPLHERFDSLYQHFSTLLTPKQFIQEFIQTAKSDQTLRKYQQHLLNYDELSGILYRHIPYTRSSELTKKLLNIFEESQLLNPQELSLIDKLPTAPLYPAEELISLAETLLLQIKKRTTFPKNLLKILVETMRKLNYLPPAPILFADTNWVDNYFGFVVNPGSMELEFWRLNPIGTRGNPMSSWRQWLDGSQRTPDWGIYTDSASKH